MFRILLCLCLAFSCLQAHGQSGQNQGKSSPMERYSPKRQIASIIYTGLVGAVLGLSTLSFYSRPQDKLTHIPLGFGLGVVLGTIYMTYQAAAHPEEFYGPQQGGLGPELLPPKPMLSALTTPSSFHGPTPAGPSSFPMGTPTPLPQTPWTPLFVTYRWKF